MVNAMRHIQLPVTSGGDCGYLKHFRTCTAQDSPLTSRQEAPETSCGFDIRRMPA